MLMHEAHSAHSHMVCRAGAGMICIWHAHVRGTPERLVPTLHVGLAQAYDMYVAYAQHANDCSTSLVSSRLGKVGYWWPQKPDPCTLSLCSAAQPQQRGGDSNCTARRLHLPVGPWKVRLGDTQLDKCGKLQELRQTVDG